MGVSEAPVRGAQPPPPPNAGLRGAPVPRCPQGPAAPPPPAVPKARLRAALRPVSRPGGWRRSWDPTLTARRVLAVVGPQDTRTARAPPRGRPESRGGHSGVRTQAAPATTPAAAREDREGPASARTPGGPSWGPLETPRGRRRARWVGPCAAADQTRPVPGPPGAPPLPAPGSPRCPALPGGPRRRRSALSVRRRSSPRRAPALSLRPGLPRTRSGCGEVTGPHGDPRGPTSPPVCRPARSPCVSCRRAPRVRPSQSPPALSSRSALLRPRPHFPPVGSGGGAAGARVGRAQS